MFSTRLGEHESAAEKVGEKTFTRSQRLASTTDTSYKSAIAEHAATNNHVIGWGEAKVIDQEANKTTRWLKEAIWIRSRGNKTMNKDEGAYKLDHIYDQLINQQSTKVSTTTVTKKKTADRSYIEIETPTTISLSRPE